MLYTGWTLSPWIIAKSHVYTVPVYAGCQRALQDIMSIEISLALRSTRKFANNYQGERACGHYNSWIVHPSSTQYVLYSLLPWHITYQTFTSRREPFTRYLTGSPWRLWFNGKDGLSAHLSAVPSSLSISLLISTVTARVHLVWNITFSLYVAAFSRTWPLFRHSIALFQAIE